MTARAWRQVAPGEWHCAPWQIHRVFLDGCTLFVLYGDLEGGPRAHCDELGEAMARARELEAA